MTGRLVKVITQVKIRLIIPCRDSESDFAMSTKAFGFRRRFVEKKSASRFSQIAAKVQILVKVVSGPRKLMGPEINRSIGTFSDPSRNLFALPKIL